MEYIGIIFGVFGLFAYLQVSSLKHRVDTLEEQLAKTAGTPLFEERISLMQAVRSNIGKKVKIEFKEDNQDVDIVMYGNTKHGSNIILDTDQEWMLVQTESPKGKKEKLIRLASVRRITLLEE